MARSSNRIVVYTLLLGVLWCSHTVLRVDCVLGADKDPQLLDVVDKHNNLWEAIDSLQLSYTKNYTAGGKRLSLPNCYWESQQSTCRSIVTLWINDTELTEDWFFDGKDMYCLTVPSHQLPLDEVKLCDCLEMSDKGYMARLIPQGRGSIGTDIKLGFPLLRYFFIPSEDKLMTLVDIVSKYPSRIISTPKNDSSDMLIGIEIKSPADNHEHYGPWSLNVMINADKGYNIDSYRLSTVSKIDPPIALIMERNVKKYTKTANGHWMASEWESISHNGNPDSGERMNYVIDQCQINPLPINENPTSRLSDFRFPANAPVLEIAPEGMPERIHLWGSEHKAARTFQNHEEFESFFMEECMQGDLPKPVKYMALRIVFVLSGLALMIYALYRLYEKKH